MMIRLCIIPLFARVFSRIKSTNEIQFMLQAKNVSKSSRIWVWSCEGKRLKCAFTTHFWGGYVTHSPLRSSARHWRQSIQNTAVYLRRFVSWSISQQHLSVVLFSPQWKMLAVTSSNNRATALRRRWRRSGTLWKSSITKGKIKKLSCAITVAILALLG